MSDDFDFDSFLDDIKSGLDDDSFWEEPAAEPKKPAPTPQRTEPVAKAAPASPRRETAPRQQVQQRPQQMGGMICPKCGGNNVNIQMVTEVKEKARKGLLYWLFIGFWWEPIAWLFLTLPKLLIAIFGRHKKVVSKTHKAAICQNCGYSWRVK